MTGFQAPRIARSLHPDADECDPSAIRSPPPVRILLLESAPRNLPRPDPRPDSARVARWRCGEFSRLPAWVGPPYSTHTRRQSYTDATSFRGLNDPSQTTFGVPG